MDGTYPSGVRGGAKPKPKAPPRPQPKRAPDPRRKPGRPSRPTPGRRKPAPGARPSPRKPEPKKPQRPMAPPKRFTPAPTKKPKPFGKKAPKPTPRFFRPRLPNLPGLIGDAIGFDPFAQGWDLFFPPQDERAMQYSPGAGWTQVNNCSPNAAYNLGPFWDYTDVVSCADSAYACLTNAAPAGCPTCEMTSPLSPTPGIGFYIGTWCSRVVVKMGREVGTTYRYHVIQTWRAPEGTAPATPSYTAPRTQRGPVPISPPLGLPDPLVDPWSPPRQDPLPQPEPAPEPAPVVDAPPHDAPVPGVVVLPQPGVSPAPGRPWPGIPVPVPVPSPLPSPVPGAPPYVVPGTSIVILPGTGIGPGVQPRPVPQPGHSRTPPPRGTREAKLSQNAVTELFKGVINLVTESADAVDAIYKAIDIRFRIEGGAVGFMSPLDKASFVWSNFHLVNWGEFMKNYFSNQLEDWFYGQLGRGSAWMQRRGGISQGFKDAALQGGSSAGTSRGDADNPVLDAINEFLDRSIDTSGMGPPRGSRVNKNWKRVNKWTKRKRG